MGDTKICPYCGKEIMAVAKKCKHCGKWLVDKQADVHEDTKLRAINPVQSETSKDDATNELPKAPRKSVSLSSKNKCFNKKAICGIVGAFVTLVIVAIGCYFAFTPKVYKGWELSYMKDKDGSVNKSQPTVSKVFQTDKGELRITFTKNGFILHGDNLPTNLESIAMCDKTSAWCDAEFKKDVNGDYIAEYSRVRDILIFNLNVNADTSYPLPLIIAYSDRTIEEPWVISANHGGENVRDAIEHHIENNSEARNVVKAPVSLNNMKDSLAYAMGVRYATAYESDGYVGAEYYGRSLKTFLGTTYGIGIENITTSPEALSISQRAFDDTMEGAPLLSPSFAIYYISCVRSDWSIYDLENKLRLGDTQRRHVLMNREYKTLQALFKKNPKYTYTTHFVRDYSSKSDSILSLPNEYFK